MKMILLLLVAIAVSSTLFAQQVSISKVELIGNKVIITYDLEDSSPNHEYLISLYASKDNFSSPLAKVSGDVGVGVKPGIMKTIEWRITEEYNVYKGILSLEIKGRVFIPVVKLEGSGMKSMYKRGKSYHIVWHPSVPPKTKTGKNYHMRFSNSKNPEEIVFSKPFKIAPKIPLLVKILPAAAIGGAILFIGGNSGGGASEGSGIPNPPVPTN